MVQTSLVGDNITDGNYVVHRREGDEVIVTAKVPDAGRYALNIHAASDGDDSYDNVCTYLVEAEAADPEYTPFPVNMEQGQVGSQVGDQLRLVSHSTPIIQTRKAEIRLIFRIEGYLSGLVPVLTCMNSDGDDEEQVDKTRGWRVADKFFVHVCLADKAMYSLVLQNPSEDANTTTSNSDSRNIHNDESKREDGETDSTIDIPLDQSSSPNTASCLYRVIIHSLAEHNDNGTMPVIRPVLGNGRLISPPSGELPSGEIIQFALIANHMTGVIARVEGRTINFKQEGSGINKEWKRSVKTGPPGSTVVIAGKLGTGRKGNKRAVSLKNKRGPRVKSTGVYEELVIYRVSG